MDIRSEMGHHVLGRLRNALRQYLRGRARYQFFLRSWMVQGRMQASADLLATMRHQRLLDPVLAEPPRRGRVCVLAPHPDDEVIGPGGALLQMLDHGVQVEVVYLTDGERDPNQARVRRAEAEASAGHLGARPWFLGLPVGAMLEQPELAAKALAVVLERTTPDQVFLPFILDDHPDHRDASLLLLTALRIAQKPVPKKVWAYQVYGVVPGNVVVDITSVAQRKADAIRMHASQMSTRDWAHYALGLNALNLRLLPPSAAPRYAESFFVLPTADYLALVEQFDAFGVGRMS